LYVIIAGILFYFFPRASLEWVASGVIAFICAYFTTANQYWVAPMGPFMLWFIADYALLQWLFSRLNKRLDRHKLATSSSSD
jgi:hypothetical protein